MMTIQVRLAQPTDESAVNALWQSARQRLHDEKIPQWQGEYPGIADFENDLHTGEGRVATLTDGTVVGYAALVTEPDPNYAQIDGQWLTQGNAYATIHRFVVSATHLHHGIGSDFMAQLIAETRKNHLPSVRIDTHAVNLPMHHLLGRFSFQHTGTVYMLDDGTARDAFELLL
ncbi:GNAT family N-acetyltransferase [Schleiferilactobacillus perolens]|jgi:GNAT superfamily N-acetyltransferase|uniref:GNAT family N-acetyltransferase n=1 Tax=Schleiferilactobacillus perolens TaxID=100468 RepID=UPI0023538B57|nr:GNAT family N-acetyltransferase [Schleiferilactobacillus perolens]MCI2171994.1 GNAT family N-acetyltransferase [Schleiferilactobacillus perolens]